MLSSLLTSAHTLTFNLDLQSSASYDHDIYTRGKSKSDISCSQDKVGTRGLEDRQTDTSDRITFPLSTNTVGIQ